MLAPQLTLSTLTPTAQDPDHETALLTFRMSLPTSVKTVILTHACRPTWSQQSPPSRVISGCIKLTVNINHNKHTYGLEAIE